MVTTPAPAAKKDILKIVTTTPTLAAVAREIGGDLAQAGSIAKGNQNLHTIPAKPSFMMKARKADLWIRVGLQLESGYERLILQGARNKKILLGNPGHLDASTNIKPLEVPTGVGAKLGLSMGDVHPLGNPHYWLDPYNIRIIGRTIADRLKQLDPNHGADYDANLKSFIARVDEATFGKALVEAAGGEKLWAMETSEQLDAYLEGESVPALGGWLGRMRPLKGTPIVPYHRSWPYFFKRFGLVSDIEIEPKPGIPPSPGHVIKVITKMKDEGIRIILMEPFYSRKAPDKIARETGASVVVAALSVGGQPEATDYFSLIDNAIGRLYAAATRQGLIQEAKAASSTPGR